LTVITFVIRSPAGAENNFFKQIKNFMNQLECMDLKELSLEESKLVQGGWWQVALAIIGAVIYIYNNADDFAKGYNDAIE
jgi:K+ transporter